MILAARCMQDGSEKAMVVAGGPAGKLLQFPEGVARAQAGGSNGMD